MLQIVKTTLHRVLTFVLVTILLVLAPGFNSAQSAQAAGFTTEMGSDRLSKETIKDIQEHAEDLGDRAERAIGDTGLKNLRNLGENIPETLDLNIRQKGEIYSDSQTTTKDLDAAQARTERAARENQ